MCTHDVVVMLEHLLRKTHLQIMVEPEGANDRDREPQEQCED